VEVGEGFESLGVVCYLGGDIPAEGFSGFFELVADGR